MALSEIEVTTWPKFILWTALGWVVASSSVAAQLPGEDAIDDLTLTGDLVVEIDGIVESSVDVYFSEYEVAHLLHGPAPIGLLLVSPRGSSVQAVSEHSFVVVDEVRVTLEADSTTGLITTFRTEIELPDNALQVGDLPREVQSFDIDGHEVRLVPADPLLGFQSREDLELRFPTFSKARSTFTSAVDWNLARPSFEKSLDDLIVRVYFRTDSKICWRVLPKMLAVAGAWPQVQFEFYGLSRRFRSDPEAQTAGLNGVPAISLIIGQERSLLLTGRQLDQPHEALLRAFEELGL